MRILTLGTFDLFHRGHVRLLARLALLGDVYVALNPDSFVAGFKGQPPVMTLDERYAVVDACRHVKAVVVNDSGPDAKPTIERVNPNYLAIGTDWLRSDYLAQLDVSVRWLEEKQIGLIYLPYTDGVSATEIRNRIAS